MEYRVLGKLEVLRDGETVDVGAYRQRALLALLLTAPNQVFSTDQLIDSLWGDDGAADRQGSLWGYVSGLRKALEPEREKRSEGSILLTRAPGYLIHVEGDAVDASRFEMLVTEGRSLSDTDPAAASLVLGEALALWRGRAFEDFTYETFAQTEIARLEELRLEAVEARIDADLRRGLSRELVSELETLVRQQPLREGFTAQLMEALYRSGRQAEALKAYQQLRGRLGDELGIEPSGRVKRLEEQIVTGDLAFTDDAPRREAGGAQTGLAIRGYELREKMGERASSVVYRAYQPSVGREVAVKVIEPELADDPDFIRRFEAEAQTVARLEHPHIVPLYDYWREPGGAYLVMRLMRGGSLQELLDTSALRPEQAATMVDQLGSALNAAHHTGVLHRDIRPDNVLIDEEGNAYLSDFAIAVEPADPNAPDQGAASATVSTDVHGLGVTVAQALTGLRGEIEQIRGALEPGVRQVIDRATSPDPAGGFEDVGSLVRSLHGALGAPTSAPLTAATDLENPYKGLRAFSGADAGDFFGRERLTERLVARLGEPGTRGRFVAVVGPSGSGKSSAVRAGLLPALRRDALPQSASWFIVETTPAPHPFEQLEDALRAIAVDPPPDLLEQLSWSVNGLHTAAGKVLPNEETQLVLLIDQFEELFTQVDPDTAERFIATLVDAIRHEQSRVRVVVTLRADFYDRPLRHRELGELLRDATEVITPMTPKELERAITGPVAPLGITVEPGLVVQLVRDVVDRSGALPLLQYALTELFDGRQGTRMTEAAYQALGGVSGALVARAEGLLGQLGFDAHEATRQVFLRLVTLGEGADDTRRRVLRTELEDLPIDRRTLSAVLDTFGRHRMLSFDRDPVSRTPTVEISHEALLTEWGRLREWIGAARHDVRNQRRLAEALTDWRAADESDEYLLRGGRLEQLHGWATTAALPLSVPEQAFLEASVAERDRAAEAERDREARASAAERRATQRARQLTIAGAMAVLVAALAVFGIVQWRSADDQRAEAEAARNDAEAARAEADLQVTATQLRLASVDLLSTDPDLALLLATAAVRETAPLGYATEEAVDAVHWALQELSVQYELDDQTPVAVRSGPGGLTGLWVTSPAELVRDAENATDRELSAEECAAYFDGACPERTPLPADLPLRFGTENYGVDPRVQGFYDSLIDAGGVAPLAGTRITLAAPLLWVDEGFRSELARFTSLTGIEVDAVATADFDLIRATDGRLDRPDVLTLWRPVPDWARSLALDLEWLDEDELRANYGDYLLEPVRYARTPDGEEAIHGLPMMIGLDALVYYPRAAFEDAGYAIPATWDELIDLSAEMVEDGHAPWCLGYQASGFADGWPGSDLIEALVLRTAGLEVYDAWLAGDIPFSDPRIVEAGRLADQLVHGPGFVRQDGGRSISTEFFGGQLFRMFDDDLVDDGPACWFTLSGDLLMRGIPDDIVLGDDLDYFQLPPVVTAGTPPTAGDVFYATALVDRPEVRAFMFWMSRRSWGENWTEQLEQSAFISPNQDFRVATIGYQNEPDDPAIDPRQRLVTEAHDALANGTFRWDASEQMPLAIGGWNEFAEPGAFWQGMLDWAEGRKSIEEVFADIDAEWAALRAGES